MSDIGIVTLILILANFIFSYGGFLDRQLFEKYKFEVDGILIHKEYVRLLGSGFLHVGWLHLGFNMFSLYAFSWMPEILFGYWQFALIYFASLIGGNLLALFIHRNHGDYSAVGASGAVSGVIFAAIAIFPSMEIHPFGLPIPTPAWLYGILFVLFSIYGIKSAHDNIGHEAHLGGALVGMLAAIALEPGLLTNNYLPILGILVPCVIFIYLIATKPHLLLIDVSFGKSRDNHYDIDHKYNARKALSQKELDKLLDKIRRKGMASLTEKEKQQLDEYSK
jgi:membrane associated rhomboid family serine protease